MPARSPKYSKKGYRKSLHKRSKKTKRSAHTKRKSPKRMRGGNAYGASQLRSGLRLPKPNVGEAAAIGLGTYALTGSPRLGLGLGLGSYYAGRLFNTQ